MVYMNRIVSHHILYETLQKIKSGNPLPKNIKRMSHLILNLEDYPLEKLLIKTSNKNLNQEKYPNIKKKMLCFLFDQKSLVHTVLGPSPGPGQWHTQTKPHIKPQTD